MKYEGREMEIKENCMQSLNMRENVHEGKYSESKSCQRMADGKEERKNILSVSNR
jgi:hypothetical protein